MVRWTSSRQLTSSSHDGRLGPCHLTGCGARYASPGFFEDTALVGWAGEGIER